MSKTRKKVRITETNLPSGFRVSPGEIVTRERKRLTKELKRATPSGWWKWYRKNVVWAFDSEMSPFFRFLFSIAHIIFWIGLLLATRNGNDYAFPLWIWFLVCSFYLLVGTESFKRKFCLFLRLQIPGSRLLYWVFDFIAELNARHAHWYDESYRRNIMAVLERDSSSLVRVCYLEQLKSLETEFIGPESKVTRDMQALREHLARARTHLEQLKYRLAEAVREKHATRQETLSALIQDQAERIVVLEVGLQEMENREAQARAFLAEAHLVAGELAGVAGDEELARQIGVQKGKDNVMLQNANRSWQALVKRLDVLFYQLHCELAQAELDRVMQQLPASSLELARAERELENSLRNTT